MLLVTTHYLYLLNKEKKSGKKVECVITTFTQTRLTRTDTLLYQNLLIMIWINEDQLTVYTQLWTDKEHVSDLIRWHEESHMLKIKNYTIEYMRNFIFYTLMIWKKKYEKQGKRWPWILRDSVLAKVFFLLLTTITGLQKSAVRYQLQKRWYSASSVNDVVLYLREILWS